MKSTVEYLIQSLELPDRLQIINDNKKIIPEIKIFKSINGYNIEETIAEFFKSGLKYKYLDFNTYGTLANYLTKINAFKYQIENNIEFMCLIEDDVILNNDFKSFIESNLHYLEKYNMLRLDNWGEGYVTSIIGSKNILKHIYNDGIIYNIDNQLREKCGPEKRLNTYWKLAVNTNEGDCLKTKTIPESEILKFQQPRPKRTRLMGLIKFF